MWPVGLRTASCELKLMKTASRKMALVSEFQDGGGGGIKGGGGNSTGESCTLLNSGT